MRKKKGDLTPEQIAEKMVAAYKSCPEANREA
jgi:hypothetical protein